MRTIPSTEPLRFHLGTLGALLPLITFLGGVAFLGLSGAPDERGFWPILLLALGIGTLFATDRERYSEAVLQGMSRPLVMTMVMAWILAGVLGASISASGFVEALIDVAGRLGVHGGALVLVAFTIAALVSTATGTSLGTLLVCVPLLHPAGVQLGADPAVLIGALLGGATFGDNVSPISDTTIASAGTQNAELGRVVRSRMRYALPAAALAIVAYYVVGTDRSGAVATLSTATGVGTLPILVGLGPLVALGLLLRRRTLLEGLMGGIVATLLLSLGLGFITTADLLSIDAEAFIARGIILSGMERSVGIVIFTLLLMGIVGGLEASGLLDRLIERIRAWATNPRRTEWSIFGAISAAVLLTTHSVVAILAVGRLAKDTGETMGIGPERRSNILDVTVCTYPFLFPFFIPTILAANLTAGDAGAITRVDAWSAGLHNFHSWGLLAVLLFSLVSGWGRDAPPSIVPSGTPDASLQ